MIVFENEVVPKERFGAELRSLVDRGTELLLVYTGMGPLAYYYKRQIVDAFPEIDLSQRAVVHFYPEADHTFTIPGNRNRLMDDIDAWMLARFATARVG